VKTRLLLILITLFCMTALVPLTDAHAAKSAQAPITREQFLTMIVKALDIPNEPINEEIPPLELILQIAKDNGLYQNDYAKAWPQPITRGEMAITLERATHKASYEAQVGQIRNLNQPNTEKKLVELKRVYDQMQTKQRIFETVRRGLLSGIGNGQLGLESTVSFESAAAVIERVLAFNKGTVLKGDKRAMAAAEVYWHSTNLFTAWSDYLGIEHAAKFDESMLYYESADFKGSITGLYIIDADDPNDPFRNKIPFSLKELFRFQGTHAFPLTSLRDAYIIVFTQTDNQLNNPKSKYPVRVQLGINGIGVSLTTHLQIPKSIREAEQKRLSQGALDFMQSVEHKAVTKEQKEISTHHVNGIQLDNSLKNYIGVYVIPKSNVKADGELRITVRPIINRNVKINEVLRVRPSGIANLSPDSVTGLYSIKTLK